MSAWSRSLAAGVLAAAVTACADASTPDLCTAYADLSESVVALRGADPVVAGVDDLRARAYDVSEQLDALQAAAEGQLDTAISTVRARVDDVRQSAVDAGEEALETARPAIEDGIEELAAAYARVEELADAKCVAD